MIYNETVLDHFANPRNAGKMSDPDAKGETGNPADGDRIIIYLRINENRLEEVSFQTFGCAAAIAASSMLTVLAMGKNIEEARGITNEHVADALGGLPSQKMTCSNIAADALHDALDQYEETSKDNHALKNQGVNTICQENMEETARQEASRLTTQQVQRYMRQIIMPEISGRGQETLLETHVILYMPSVEWGEMMLAYLAAVGMGQVTCVLDDIDSGDGIMKHVQDLNPEMKLKMIPVGEPEIFPTESTQNAFIVIGPIEYVETHQQKLNQASRETMETMENEPENQSPAVFVGVRPWQGTLQTRGYRQVSTHTQTNHTRHVSIGEGLSTSFGGIMAVIELVKLRLGIGQQLTKPFVYDLMNMTFGEEMGAEVEDCHGVNINKNLNCLKDNTLRQRLEKGKVLLVGSGGLGSPAAYALAKAGVGTLGLVDHDQVDLSNLNRQILHTTSRIGMPKVESGAKTLQMLNPEMTVNIYQERMTDKNADKLLQAYDLLLDGLDNLPSRYVANKAAVAAAKPFVSAGVLTFYGQSTSILPGDGPCYECVFPKSDDNGNAPTCEETGVLGAVPGLMGVIQAVEVIKQLCGLKPSLHNKYLMVDTLESDFTSIEFTQRPGCSICSRNLR